jgi:hypothetical protein
MQLKLWFFAGHDIVNPDLGEGAGGVRVGDPSPVLTGMIVVVTLEVEVVVVLMQCGFF